MNKICLNFLKPAIFLFFCLGLALSLRADTEMKNLPFLQVSLDDGSVKEYLIDNNFQLYPDSEGYLNFTSVDFPVEIDRMKNLGIIYKDVAVTGIETNMEGRDYEEWSITTLDGHSVASGISGIPDYSTLEPGTVYLVNIGNKSYKYLHLK